MMMATYKCVHTHMATSSVSVQYSGRSLPDTMLVTLCD